MFFISLQNPQISMKTNKKPIVCDGGYKTFSYLNDRHQTVCGFNRERHLKQRTVKLRLNDPTAFLTPVQAETPDVHSEDFRQEFNSFSTSGTCQQGGGPWEPIWIRSHNKHLQSKIEYILFYVI